MSERYSETPSQIEHMTDSEQQAKIHKLEQEILKESNSYREASIKMKDVESRLDILARIRILEEILLDSKNPGT